MKKNIDNSNPKVGDKRAFSKTNSSDDNLNNKNKKSKTNSSDDNLNNKNKKSNKERNDNSSKEMSSEEDVEMTETQPQNTPAKTQRKREFFLFHCEKCRNYYYFKAFSQNNDSVVTTHQKKCKECPMLENHWKEVENNIIEKKLSPEQESLKKQIVSHFCFETALVFILEIFCKTKVDLLQQLMIPIKENGKFTSILGLKAMNFKNVCKCSIQKLNEILNGFWNLFFNFDINIQMPSCTTLSRMFNAYSQVFYPWVKSEIKSNYFHIILDIGSKLKKAYCSIIATFWKNLSEQEIESKKSKLKELEKIKEKSANQKRKIRYLKRVIRFYKLFSNFF